MVLCIGLFLALGLVFYLSLEPTKPLLDTGRIRYIDVSRMNDGAVYDVILEVKMSDGNWYTITERKHVFNFETTQTEQTLKMEWIKYCRKNGKRTEKTKKIDDVTNKISGGEIINNVVDVMLTREDVDFLNKHK